MTHQPKIFDGIIWVLNGKPPKPNWKFQIHKQPNCISQFACLATNPQWLFYDYSYQLNASLYKVIFIKLIIFISPLNYNPISKNGLSLWMPKRDGLSFFHVKITIQKLFHYLNYRFINIIVFYFIFYCLHLLKINQNVLSNI